MRYLETGLSKDIKKLTWSFLLHPGSFYGQDYEKQKEHGTSSQLPFKLENMYRKTTLLLIYLQGNFDF